MAVTGGGALSASGGGKGVDGELISPKPERGCGPSHDAAVIEEGLFCHPFHGNTCVTLLGCCHTQPKDRSRNEYSVMNAGGNADRKNEVQIKKLWDSSLSVSVLIAFSVGFCYVLYCLTEQKKNRIRVYCVLSCKYLFRHQ